MIKTFFLTTIISHCVTSPLWKSRCKKIFNFNYNSLTSFPIDTYKFELMGEYLTNAKFAKRLRIGMSTVFRKMPVWGKVQIYKCFFYAKVPK